MPCIYVLGLVLIVTIKIGQPIGLQTGLCLHTCQVRLSLLRK